MSMDELTHVLKQLVTQETGGRGNHVYGHIGTYNIQNGTVKVVFPSFRNEDGTPTMSAWIPLSTGWAGPTGTSFGMQYHPIGGASLENPTAGEQVLVTLLDQDYGTAVSAALCFNSSSPPPRQDILPGELVIQGQMGGFIRWHANGDMEINSEKNVTIIADGVVNLIAPLVNIMKAIGDTVQFLCTKAFYDWAASHTHPDVGPPDTDPPTDSLTTVAKAE